MKTGLHHACLAGVVAALLAGCATPAEPPRPEVAMPATFAEAVTPTTPVPPPAADWWEAFDDATLNGLETDVVASNASLAAALGRLRQARAQVELARSALSPQLGLTLGASRAHTSANVLGRSLAGKTVNDYSASLGASWEPDLFGRLGQSVTAAQLDAQATAADAEALRLALQAEVARDYLTLRSLDEEGALLTHLKDDQLELVQLTRQRLADGTVSELDVDQAQAGVETLLAQIVDLGASRAAMAHALATLTGRPAGTLAVPALSTPAALAVPELSPGIPADLLVRRADVAAAQDRVAAANQRAGLARLAWFPSLMLSLTSGLESSVLPTLLGLPSRMWAAGPSVSLPLLDGGRRRAVLQGAEAGIDVAAADYRARVLAAINEVEDQLATLNTLQVESGHQSQAVALSTKAVTIAGIRYDAGAVDYAQVMLARQSQISAERDALLLRRRQLLASVDLVRALGGGWRGDGPDHLAATSPIESTAGAR